MAKRVTCPNCGNYGEVSIDRQKSFVIRGQYNGKGVWQCNKCGDGLFVGFFSGLFMGEPELVPYDMWERMKMEWNTDY